MADRHFEMFYDVSKRSRSRMTELFEEASPQAQAKQEINLDSLTAYLLTKLPERAHSDSKAVSELVDELLKAGYRSIGEVDQLLDSASKAFIEFETQTEGKFSDVGVVRISAQIANGSFL